MEKEEKATSFPQIRVLKEKKKRERVKRKKKRTDYGRSNSP